MTHDEKEKKTMKNDEEERNKNNKMIKNDERVFSLFFLSF